jgi:hypothetical protein
MKQLNLYYLGGGGGGSVPNGKTVTPINDATIWQQCAGISNPTYTTIVEILADTGILQTLMADNNAVDYLVRSKYFIGSASGLVPIMTSNTTPSGVVSAKTAINPAYKAFDGDDTTYWNSNTLGSVSEGSWIQYAFDNPVVVNKVGFKPYSVGAWKKYYIAASNDGVTWTQVTEEQTVTSADMQYLAISGSTPYLYWRAVNTLIEGSLGSTTPTLYTLQLYNDGVTSNSDAMYYVGQNNYCANTLLVDATWRTAICGSTYKNSVINAQIPQMTSNNTPVGECSGTSITTDFDYWKAFNSSEIKGWMPGGSDYYNVAKVFYHFPNAVIPCIADLLWLRPASSTTTIKVIGSNDGLDWTDLTSSITLTNNVAQNGVSLASGNKYEYVGLVIVSNSVSVSAGEGYKLQIYGRKDV